MPRQGSARNVLTVTYLAPELCGSFNSRDHEPRPVASGA